MKYLIIILLAITPFITNSQTVIEMFSPLDAQIILLEVDTPSHADVFIYKTKSQRTTNYYWKAITSKHLNSKHW